MKLLHDSVVALITPFTSEDKIDFQVFEKLLEFHLNNQTAGIVVAGTTGEAATLSLKEKLLLLEVACKVVKNKIPIVFGSGGNNTAEVVELSKSAEKHPIDGLLIVNPYYNRPTQEGIYQHYQKISQNIALPIYIYNVPSRTGSDITLETIYRLAELKNVKGIKDAVADLSRPYKIRKHLGNDFILLSGEDETFLSYRIAGGNGCISVSANIIPKLCQEIHKLFNNNQIKEATALQTHLISLHGVLFCESNPTPVKYALSLLNLAKETSRLPLVPLAASNKEKVASLMKDLKLI
ncbi:4-hydroxy-tetrahydrodipicolinate synthase [Candidatus Hepatincolaceae symbiont of Richtersius coronifer]